jgi:hypothetical protein
MELFNELGCNIEKLWCDKNYDEGVFPDIAAEALKNAHLPEKVSVWEVFEWTLRETNLPVQRDLAGRFGNPPITLYNSPRFYIDIYFWLEGATTIHQHGFCGAFQVLLGSSIHSWYEFDCQEKVNTFTEIGDINLKSCELLSVGDVQRIWAGKSYIHGLFHLDEPSATIIVRTHNIPLHLPQFAYYKPFLAVDPTFDEPNTAKKMQCLVALIRIKHPDADKFIADWLKISDFQTSYKILSMVRSFLQSNQVDQRSENAAPQSRFEAIMEIVKERHGERADILPKVFAHKDKIDEIIKRRNFVKNSEHRFFLALLMNVEGKEEIFSLVKQRFPDAEPLDKILDWAFDLAQTRIPVEKTPNALGVADFGALDLLILESLLKNTPDDEMEKILESQYGMQITDETRQNIKTKRANIHQSEILEPLFK